MEIYMSNIATSATKDEVSQWLKPGLAARGINVYEFSKPRNKTIGFLTITDLTKATEFLSSVRLHGLAAPFTFAQGTVKFSTSRKPPNPQLLKVLRKEEQDWQSHGYTLQRKKDQLKAAVSSCGPRTETIPFSQLECGFFENTKHNLTYKPCYVCHTEGKFLKEDQSLVLSFTNASSSVDRSIVIDEYSIRAAYTSSLAARHVLLLKLFHAPKIYAKYKPVGSLAKETIFRESKLPEADELTSGHCLVYRITLSCDTTMNELSARLRHVLPSSLSIRRLAIMPQETITTLSWYKLQLEQAVSSSRLPFVVRFQLHALWANGVISPMEVLQLLPKIISMCELYNGNILATILKKSQSYLTSIDFVVDTKRITAEKVADVLDQQSQYLGSDTFMSSREQDRQQVSIHRVSVTPTGIYLDGPEDVITNRVLRQYDTMHDCFLRVTFCDEEFERVDFDRNISNERIYRDRFLAVLHRGLDVAGEHFDFLGFSHSSLRSQTCWFMRPLVFQGRQEDARGLIQKLGDFSNIRSPAKCAARIGQAFSETHTAISISPQVVQQVPDFRAGQYLFSDGCGTVSRSIWRKLRGHSSSTDQPTSYQIRYQGAKGMITLDTSIAGDALRLRPSMIKFHGSPSNDIEICGTNAKPLPFKLNRQIIKLLEDLGIPFSVFESLQQAAVAELRQSARSVSSAVNFLSRNLSDSASKLPTLLKALVAAEIDATEDSFLRDILGALLQLQLRQIKYRSRILVPEGINLYGICDEYGWLEEGEVYVTYTTDEGVKQVLQGVIAVSRSPALHPGDIQIVTAVNPPFGSTPASHTSKLKNCIVFNRKGPRDLPSMLSGGDLDGDLFHIIYDTRLVPTTVYSPAAYLAPPALDIGRTVVTKDMTAFFVDFMQNDQLARIATLHTILADCEPQGSKAPSCLLLAELHSTAVDFSKTGVAVNVMRIPKSPLYRPDFMAPRPSTKVEKGIHRSKEEASQTAIGKRKFRYYESERVIGKLYRAIDEDVFFEELEDDTSSIFSHEPLDDVLPEILEVVLSSSVGRNWALYVDKAGEVRDYYESTMLDMMYQYGDVRSGNLTEKEVFVGTILGRSGNASRRERERSDEMKARFQWELQDLTRWMKQQTQHDEERFLSLVVACLHRAVNYPSMVTPPGHESELRSFGWIVAALCMPQVFDESYD